MDLEQRHLLDELTRELQRLEVEEERINEQLQRIQVKKKAVRDQIIENSDSEYQQERLTALYEQRKKK